MIKVGGPEAAELERAAAAGPTDAARTTAATRSARIGSGATRMDGSFQSTRNRTVLAPCLVVRVRRPWRGYRALRAHASGDVSYADRGGRRHLPVQGEVVFGGWTRWHATSCPVGAGSSRGSIVRQCSIV